MQRRTGGRPKGLSGSPYFPGSLQRFPRWSAVVSSRRPATLVIGRHRRDRWRDFFFRPPSQTVRRAASCPPVANPFHAAIRQPMTRRRLLRCLDDSEEGHRPGTGLFSVPTRRATRKEVRRASGPDPSLAVESPPALNS